MKQIFFAFFIILFFQNANAASLDRFQSYVRDTKGAKGDFEQKVYDKGGKLVQESRGTFAFQRPGKFRWTYAKPPQVIVGDGERVWIHDSDLNQVTVRRIVRAIGATPAALLAGASDIENAFELSEAGMKNGLEWMEAKPKEKEAGFERIRLGLSSSGIEGMELVDHFGQTTVLRFTNLARNPQMEAGIFRFSPPKGADVLGDK